MNLVTRKIARTRPIENCLTLIQKHGASADRNFISTGLFPLDQKLQGGMKFGTITEVCGIPGTGKTQFCIEACSQCLISTFDIETGVRSDGKFKCIACENFYEAKRGIKIHMKRKHVNYVPIVIGVDVGASLSVEEIVNTSQLE
jgi:replicative DNA helicase